MERNKIPLTQEDLNRYCGNGYLTVKRLKEFIKDLPDDGLVLVQRIEDKYYDGVDISGMSGCSTTGDGIYPEGSKGEGWRVVLKEGEFYHMAQEFNRKIRDGEFGDRRKYPSLDSDFMKEYTEDDLRLLMEEYSPAWSCVRYGDDKTNLYLDLHY